MNATAQVPSRNGDGPKHEALAYRKAVRATMKKREAGPGGRILTPSDAEVDQFLLECRIYGLEPLAGQIYAVWENGAMRAVTTIDGMRLLAERTGLYDGQSDPEWCDNEGNWTDYWSGEEEPLAARVRVYRKGTKVPTTGTANWHDFAPQGIVGADSLWTMGAGKPAHMLSIRAEALALRKAFPSELSGLYAAEELGISPAALGAGAEEPASPSPAAEEPLAPSPSPPAGPVALPDSVPPAAAGSEEVPGVIVDAAAEQPSGAPARPQAKRTLAEALASGEYQRLRGELTAALFDQVPDRLTDEQSARLAAALGEAEEAGITPVELERICKIALKEGKDNLEDRSRALLRWISERRHKADGAEAGSAEDQPRAPSAQSAEPGPQIAPRPEPSPGDSLLDGDPGPQ